MITSYSPASVIQVLLKSLLPVSSLDESWWFDKALNDDACYHATLFLSAAHSALISESYHDLPQNSYWHKGEAIRIINRRLFDPNQRIEDGTLAAIACLAAYEVCVVSVQWNTSKAYISEYKRSIRHCW